MSNGFSTILDLFKHKDIPAVTALGKVLPPSTFIPAPAPPTISKGDNMSTNPVVPETAGQKFKSFLDKLGNAFQFGVGKAINLEQKTLPFLEAITPEVTALYPPAGAALSVGEAAAVAIFTPIIKSQQASVALGNTGTGLQNSPLPPPMSRLSWLSFPVFQVRCRPTSPNTATR